MDNKIKLDESFIDKEGGVLEFIYNGTAKNSNIDISNVKYLLNKFKNRNLTFSSMETNLRILRTILRDFNEDSLFISYENNDFIETLEYDNYEISYFYKEDMKNNMTIDYEKSHGIEVKYDNNNIINNIDDIKLTTDRINTILQEMHRLNKVKEVELTDDNKLLIEVYKSFYNEDPDFSDEFINNKIQAMMSILCTFNLGFTSYDYIDKYGAYFDKYRDETPFSISLYGTVNNLFPLGKITNVENPYYLSNRAEKEIAIIGETIRNTESYKENELATLSTFSKVAYGTNYSQYHFDDSNDIASRSSCPVDKVESYLKLVKKINERIDVEIKNI